MILEELEGHIEDQKLDYMADGMNADEAEEEAVRQMGAGPDTQAQDGLETGGGDRCAEPGRPLSAMDDLPAARLRLQGRGGVETGEIHGPGSSDDGRDLPGRLYGDREVCFPLLDLCHRDQCGL